MNSNLPKVKHIEALCPKQPCWYQGFVQVVEVGNAGDQLIIDTKAEVKIKTELTKQHEDGLHDRR